MSCSRPARYGAIPLLALALVASACGGPPPLPPPAERQVPVLAAAASGSVPERLLPLSKAHNVRDLGGYISADGRRVKWGQLYRADSLSKLDVGDLDYLARLGLRRVVDFRSEREQEGAPDRLPAGAEHRSLPMEARGANGQDLLQMLRDSDVLNATDTAQLMRDINRQLVREYTSEYRDWLRQLATEESAAPQIFHCRAGKDRTGLAAAILLTALGVPRDQIMADYLLSASYLAGHNERRLRMIRLMSLLRIDADAMRPLMTVEASFLEAAFAEAEQRYGSFDAYLREGLGVDDQLRARLRARFLEAVPDSTGKLPLSRRP